MLATLTATAPATLIVEDPELPEELVFAVAALGSLGEDELFCAPRSDAWLSPLPRAPEAALFTPFELLPEFC